MNLVENLDRDRFEPVVLSFTDGPMVNKLKDMGVQTEVIYTERPFDISKWSKVKRFMQTNRISLVHAHGTRANSNVFWAAKRLQLPLVYTIHGWSFHPDQKPLLKKIRIMGEQLLTSKTDVNISVSMANQESGKKYIKGFQSVIVNYGIDQKKFNPDRPLNNVRKELQIPDDTTIVLFVARFLHQKQPLKLVEAFGRVAHQLPHVKLLMVGDGDQKPRALEMVKALGISDRVIFQPFRQDVPDVLAAADMYVLPSLWEGLPIGLLEAMAMRKAIICTRVDGTPEVIQQGQNGIMINTDKMETDIGEAIVRLANDPALRSQLGREAQATISSTFSAPTMTRHIESIYTELLEKYRK